MKKIKLFFADKANQDVFLWLWHGIKYLIIPTILAQYLLGDLLFNAIFDNIFFLFVIVAAICNAVIDTISHHYATSVFNKLTPQFWNAEISWLNKYDYSKSEQSVYTRKKLFWKINFPVQISDAFHLFKTLMLLSFGFAIVLYKENLGLWIDLLAVGYYYNTTFSLFYDLILRRKKNES